MDGDFIAQDYRLQFPKCTSNHFEDLYVGYETELTVLHIDPNVTTSSESVLEESADGSGVLGSSPR